jgi:hypothetical protein
VAARLQGGLLSVTVDAVEVWSGAVSADGLDTTKSGSAGVRSDNVRIELRALEASR